MKERDPADDTNLDLGIPTNSPAPVEGQVKMNPHGWSRFTKLLYDMAEEESRDARRALVAKILKIACTETEAIPDLDYITKSPGADFFNDTATRPDLQQAALPHISTDRPLQPDASSSPVHERPLSHSTSIDLDAIHPALRTLPSVQATGSGEVARLVSTQPPTDLGDRAHGYGLQTMTQSSTELSTLARSQTAGSTNPTTIAATENASESLTAAAEKWVEKKQSDLGVKKPPRKRLRKQKKVEIAPCPDPLCHSSYQHVGRLINHIKDNHGDLKLPAYCTDHKLLFDSYAQCFDHWIYHDSPKEQLTALRSKSKRVIGLDQKKLDRGEYDRSRAVAPYNLTTSSGHSAHLPT